jgi:transketolase
MAIAEKFLAAEFNRAGRTIVDHHTFVLAGDGDMMEGISHEAASLAGHLKLGKLVVLYDDNRVTIEGATSLAFSEDVPARFAACGWHVRTVGDGNDLSAIAAAIDDARRESERPSLIAVRTVIGWGSPGRQGTEKCHGEPLGADEVRRTKENLGWPLTPPFLVPDEARGPFLAAADRGRAARAGWRGDLAALERDAPDAATRFREWMAGELPAGWDADLAALAGETAGQATRASSGRALAAIAKRVTNLLGGSADLGTSVKTILPGETDFAAASPGGRNLRFGVREHAMGAIANGIAYHGGLIPYASTFLVFSDYMRPAIRMAALSRLRVVFVFSHDSVGLGEDGPTHQPIEHLAGLRAIPGLVVLRPADAAEIAEAWRVAMTHAGPVVLVLTRQNVPAIARPPNETATGLRRGGYVLSRERGARPDVVLLATGSEVAIALAAAETLRARGRDPRVVSLPSWELFEAQPASYREEILPPAVAARVSIEAAATFSWSRYVGDRGIAIGIDRFGASAPGEVLYEKFGITADRVVAAALSLRAD